MTERVERTTLVAHISLPYTKVMFLSETALIISVAQLCEGIMINLFLVDVTSKILKSTNHRPDQSEILDTTYAIYAINKNEIIMKS